MKVKLIEKRIFRIEGFEVLFCHYDGGDVRSDKDLPWLYSFERAAPGRMTVAQWQAKRVGRCYPGFIVLVLGGDGYVTHGKARLDGVRASYEGE